MRTRSCGLDVRMSEAEPVSRTERRILTCLVLDVVGSTDLLTGRVGPDRLKDELGRFFPSAEAVVVAAGGIVEKFTGDGLLAVFGLGRAHEDDPIRALRAAVDCARLASEARSRGEHLAVRIALETGDALVDAGPVISGQEHGIVGVCVNLASRLQEKGGSGEVLVGPVCHELVADWADFEPVGPFDLKGLGAVAAWRLQRLLEAHATVRPPFVGRAEEMARLTKAREQAGAGQPRFILVVGPPGQGKSRLVEEFVGPLAPDVELLSARCRPDDERGSENPLRQLLQSNGAVASVADLVLRLDPLIHDPPERLRVARALAHSAGIELVPELLGFRIATREAEFVLGWRRYIEALSRDRLVVVRLEDLQWSEPSVTRIWTRLAEEGPSRLLVVATARPETLGAVALRPGTHLIQLDLGPLDADAALSLAHSVGSFDAGGLDRAQGNPLFLLELARSSDHGGAVPLTIQAAIAAHLDALAATDRSLLISASVIGDDFRAGEVAAVTGLPPVEVNALLARLATLRYLVSEAERFQFHHRLVRDVAYSRLPVADRLRLHARFAQEGVAPGEVEALAHHWWLAFDPAESDWVWKGDPDRPRLQRLAYGAQLASARRHLERAASDRALEVARRAAALASAGEELADAEELIGLIYRFRGDGDEAWSAWLRALSAYRSAGRAIPVRLYVQMVRFACWVWGSFRTRPRPEVVVELMDEGTRAARASGDIVALANLLICRRGFIGEAPELEEVLEKIETDPDLTAVGDLLTDLATVQALEGDLEASLATCDRVDALIARGARLDAHQVLLWRYLALFHAGDLTGADRVAQRSAKVTERMNPHFQTHSLGMLVGVAVARGQWVEVERLAAETERIVAENPTLGFCLVGASTIAWGNVSRLLRRVPPNESMEALLLRMIPESAAVRASILFLPTAMGGSDRWLGEAEGAYRASTQFWDRQEWDPFGVNLAIGLALLDRWTEFEPYGASLDRGASHGGRLCAALKDALLEERHRHSAGGGPSSHAQLRALGYTGLSELLSFRPGTPPSPD
jgi:class 3 adenylate cyclase